MARPSGCDSHRLKITPQAPSLSELGLSSWTFSEGQPHIVPGSVSPPMGGPSSPGKLVLQMEASVCWACCMCREVLKYLEGEASSGASSLHSYASFCCLHDHSRQDSI